MIRSLNKRPNPTLLWPPSFLTTSATVSWMKILRNPRLCLQSLFTNRSHWLTCFLRRRYCLLILLVSRIGSMCTVFCRQPMLRSEFLTLGNHTPYPCFSGFTAWSSSREPHQVFTLLESAYGAFDHIAKRRRIFKGMHPISVCSQMVDVFHLVLTKEWLFIYVYSWDNRRLVSTLMHEWFVDCSMALSTWCLLFFFASFSYVGKHRTISMHRFP